MLPHQIDVPWHNIIKFNKLEPVKIPLELNNNKLRSTNRIN